MSTDRYNRPPTGRKGRYHRASADEVLDEVERRLRDTEWSDHPGDRCRVALLHIDAYRSGGAMAPDSTPPPSTCPTCGSDDPVKHGEPIVWNGDLYCCGPWHGDK